VRVAGRAGWNRNLSLVLEGNIPRFPRMTIMPSTTMLTRRLTGTTDGSGFDRNTPRSCAHPADTPAWSTTGKGDITVHIFCPHGGASEAPLNC